uniref:Aminotransferase class I/classII large domain-containing protein n=1 Tax=Mucochytrium quahogii TaxID=96639 RepID=A0A7S2SE60_9STRA|mmetsp:Transcript_17825/g.28866  ORF Transcript_17825/g.28866 Transcript_17825/m.28866 type:complete len:390 (+) Transcript_17825:214-1383(+)
MEDVAGFSPFALERYFAKYEFTAPHLGCCSDCEPLTMKELIAMADADSLNKWENLSLGYTESNGLPELRDEVASMYNATISQGENDGWEVDKDNVFVVAPEEGIYITVRAVLQKGDHVVFPSPCYQSMSEIAKSIGCVLNSWEQETDKQGALTHFSVDRLRKLVTKDTKLVIVNFPHNPTGAMVSRKQWAEIMEICRENGCYLLSDEMYWGLEYNPQETQLIPACKIYDKAISLSGMSKSLALPGLRIGWLVTQDNDLLRSLKTLKDYTTICPPAPSEILSLMALRARDRIIARNLEIIGAGLEAAKVFFAKHSDKFYFTPPVAGTICFPRLLTGCTYEFCTNLAEKHGIVLLPSSVYGLPHDPQCFRLGLGRRNVPSILSMLDKVITN